MKKTVLKTSLDHLPARYQHDLLAIQEIILKCLPTEMIIPFGGYARGDYMVETKRAEEGIAYEHISAYGILVVTEKEIPIDRWWELKEAIDKRPTQIPSTLIHHTVSFVNERIRDNYYFFVDIIKEGIMLYDSGQYELAAPTKLNPKKRLEKARNYFDSCFKKGDNGLDIRKFLLEQGYYNEAVFQLLQSVENYYNILSLVLTGYKSHQY